MQSLVFFNKEGDNLNFRWAAGYDRFEGSLIFHENSNDTFKTIGIYTFEKIPSFEYEVPGILKLEKFQLFNEYRFNYTGNTYFTQSVTKIETVNNDPTFYSKWIYGLDFEKKYPIGSQILFNVPIFEFTNPNQSYTVVQTKKNAVLVLSSLDNQQFNNIYGVQLGLSSSYTNLTISGLNSIGVYNYVDSSLRDNLSSWSEPDFYLKYFNGKKITLVNTEKNDGVYTINNIDIFDKTYKSYELSSSSLTQSQNVLLELILKTDLPTVYDGAVTLQDNTITFGGEAPAILRPGVEFTVPYSISNTNALRIDSISQYDNNVNTIYYATQSLVFWRNRVYECIQAFTWTANWFSGPPDPNYWIPATYLPLTTVVVNEIFLNTQIQLTTNKLYYVQNFTQSSVSTLASLAENYRQDLRFFNIDLYYENSSLYSELIYPTEYAQVNYILFTQSQGGYGTNSVGLIKTVYEQNVGVKEILTPEVNENICENFSYNLVFTDIDEYGIKIRINGQEYEEPTDFIYTGTVINLPRTIDRTLRNWFITYYNELVPLGIIPLLQYVGSGPSIYLNSINLQTEYPNVPLQFEVRVGSTADFYIEHSEVIFYQMSNYLELTINNRTYGQVVNVVGGIADIETALDEWIISHQATLDDYGIYVTNINSMLIFKLKKQNTRLDYTVRVGLSSLPGVEYYKRIDKIQGKFGALMSSNEIILPESGTTYSFELEPFATGQLVAINNTSHPIMNREYNILYLGPYDIVLSYEGPFWGTTDPYCDVSPYITVAFNSGFGATGCVAPIVPTYSGLGQFNLQQFTQSFNLYNPTLNTYTFLDLELYGNSNLVDILFLPLTNDLYVLGDKLTVVDGEQTNILQNITLSGIGTASSIMMKYNDYNDYLYCLASDRMYVVDPIVYSVLHTITFSYTAHSLEVNTLNGDVYVSYTNNTYVRIWDQSNFTNTPTTSLLTSGNTLNFVYNDVENDMYVTQDNDYLLRIDSSTRTIQTSYYFNNLYERIFYEPINSSIYLFDNVGLKNFNNGTHSVISNVGTASFNEVLYDQVMGDISISQNTIFTNIELDGAFDRNFGVAHYGYLSVSPYDGLVYMAVQNSNTVLILEPSEGRVNFSSNLAGRVDKFVFNPKRKSMFGIQPTLNKLIEINVVLTSLTSTASTTYSVVSQDMYGTLDPNYVPHPDLWLKTREYIRKPRENYNNEPFVKYVWKWETDEYPQMFMFDFSGSLLPTSGSYAYTGPKPLTEITLSRYQNKDLTKTSLPQYQKTIFDEIVTTLEHVDSEDDFSSVPEPLELFLGFRSDDEGYMSSNLLLQKRYDIDFTLIPTSTNNDYVTFKFVRDPINGDYGIISLDVNSTSNFTYDENDIPRGLKAGQDIKVYLNDITNNRNKYNSINNGKIFKIRNVYTRQLIIDFDDILLDETNVIENYPITLNTTYLSVRFKTMDLTIGRFRVSGQTEIEDIRYKIELNNVGQNVGPSDVFIFKSYDINEGGIDWTFLNRKRKEMMMVRHDIYPYIGSYKAIINAINYFGYNDLELYEYYRNINVDSPDFFKLFKVEIPDIFDNSVPGWTINDFISHTMPNPNYEDTNLFNLTFKITDKEGNNVLNYSLDEVVVKLQGLKYWLQRQVIPITHRILDITGRADWVGTNTIVHRNYDTRILNLNQSLTPIDFVLSEAYLMPVNSGSTVYTCHIDFFTGKSTEVPEYFSLVVRTYKTYKEWNPFTTYTLGEKVIYYGNIYENKLSNSKLKNPRKWDNVSKWNDNTDYTLGQFVKYDEYLYQYVGASSSFTIFGTSSQSTPLYDINTNGSLSSWRDNTDWRKVDWEPVQYLTEYRTATHSYNFTIDSNIDPFVVIEVTSDNGYGAIYTSKKNYEIRGTNDLFIGYKGDQILPFEPIIQITAPFINDAPPL